jgi:hypothetical protein
MTKTKKIAIAVVVGLIISLYRTFVLQNLWNWFATKALNAKPLVYWETYGLNMVVSLLFSRRAADEAQESRWTLAFTALAALLPDERKSLLAEETNESNKLATAVTVMFQEFMNATFALVLGWFVYWFLI